MSAVELNMLSSYITPLCNEHVRLVFPFNFTQQMYNMHSEPGDRSAGQQWEAQHITGPSHQYSVYRAGWAWLCRPPRRPAVSDVSHLHPACYDRTILNIAGGPRNVDNLIKDSVRSKCNIVLLSGASSPAWNWQAYIVLLIVSNQRYITPRPTSRPRTNAQ